MAVSLLFRGGFRFKPELPLSAGFAQHSRQQRTSQTKPIINRNSLPKQKIKPRRTKSNDDSKMCITGAFYLFRKSRQGKQGQGSGNPPARDTYYTPRDGQSGRVAQAPPSYGNGGRVEQTGYGNGGSAPRADGW
ncbi:hypothetical protein PRZ48_009731 [Zasmidium cellare]|uniref:Uncharacterized protein n=1 Tax=Zasmidium cellare TaxID=395010 RepID=A0ABR0EDF2_ZASCE|nr:hypothetical protein PRZ48_009731 [Zasmidium cellare]